jgi:predicted transcriptional regulator of viral defense system
MVTLEIIKTIQGAGLKLFTLADLKRLLNIESDNTAYKLAGRLTKRGVLGKIRKGMYFFIFSRPSDFEIANFLYSPSYISLESALNFHGLLPQFPYIITSVTPRKTTRVEALGKEFEYVHFSPKYFFGFGKTDQFLIACPEKALVDEVYFTSKGLRHIEIEDLDLSRLDRERFEGYARQIPYRPFHNLIKEMGL